MKYKLINADDINYYGYYLLGSYLVEITSMQANLKKQKILKQIIDDFIEYLKKIEITSERSKDHSSVITSNTSERSKDHSSVLAEIPGNTSLVLTEPAYVFPGIKYEGTLVTE